MVPSSPNEWSFRLMGYVRAQFDELPEQSFLHAGKTYKLTRGWLEKRGMTVVTINCHGFSSESGARVAGEDQRKRILGWSIVSSTATFFSDGDPHSRFNSKIIDSRTRPFYEGLCVYRRSDVDHFIGTIESPFVFNVISASEWLNLTKSSDITRIPETISTASQLLSLARIMSSNVLRLIAAMASIEAACPDPGITNEQKDVVRKLLNYASELNADIELKNALAGLTRTPIKSRCRTRISTLLGTSRGSDFSRLYDSRSAFMHGRSNNTGMSFRMVEYRDANDAVALADDLLKAIIAEISGAPTVALSPLSSSPSVPAK